MIKGDDEMLGLLAEMSASQYGEPETEKVGEKMEDKIEAKTINRTSPEMEILRYQAQQSIKSKFESLSAELGVKIPNVVIEKWQFAQKMREEEEEETEQRDGAAAAAAGGGGGGCGGGDPLLPSDPDPHDPGLMGHLMDRGVGLEQARQAAAEAARHAARACAALRQARARLLGPGGGGGGGAARGRNRRRRREAVLAEDRGGGVLALTRGGYALRLNAGHRDKLRAWYRRANGGGGGGSGGGGGEGFGGGGGGDEDPPGFLDALFACLLRYEGLQGGGFQAALPEALFAVLRRRLACAHECFASPFNARTPSYCSAFPDTDTVFGSHGSFFTFSPEEGVYEANPPFVPAVVRRMSKRIEALLAAAASKQKDLMFIVIIPAWQKEEAWVEIKNSKYLTKYLEIPQKSHGYYEGKQQLRRTKYRIASSDSSIFFLQSQLQSKKWEISEKLVSEIKTAFDINKQRESIEVDQSNEEVKQQQANDDKEENSPIPLSSNKKQRTTLKVLTLAKNRGQQQKKHMKTPLTQHEHKSGKNNKVMSSSSKLDSPGVILAGEDSQTNQVAVTKQLREYSNRKKKRRRTQEGALSEAGGNTYHSSNSSSKKRNNNNGDNSTSKKKKMKKGDIASSFKKPLKRNKK